MKPENNQLLWWAGLGFAVLISAWVVFFVVASRHPVVQVPLSHVEAKR